MSLSVKTFLYGLKLLGVPLSSIKATVTLTKSNPNLYNYENT